MPILSRRVRALHYCPGWNEQGYTRGHGSSKEAQTTIQVSCWLAPPYSSQILLVLFPMVTCSSGENKLLQHNATAETLKFNAEFLNDPTKLLMSRPRKCCVTQSCSFSRATPPIPIIPGRVSPYQRWETMGTTPDRKNLHCAFTFPTSCWALAGWDPQPTSFPTLYLRSSPNNCYLMTLLFRTKYVLVGNIFKCPTGYSNSGWIT